MKHKLILPLLGFVALLANACDLIEDEYHHYHIDVDNQSDDPISASYHLYYLYDSIRVSAGRHGRLAASEGFVCGFGPSLHIFESFMNYDSLTITIRHGVTESLMLQYVLSRDNLYELGWSVPYPPSAEMSNMKICYPEEQ